MTLGGSPRATANPFSSLNAQGNRPTSMADLLQALQSVRPPPPPLIDRSSLLPRPPQQVGPATVPGLVKLQAQVAKELAGSDKVRTLLSLVGSIPEVAEPPLS